MKNTEANTYFIKPNVKRGDVYYCDLPNDVGSVQYGSRPVVVLQNDVGNYHSDLTIIAPITTKKDTNRMPTHVTLLSKKYPLIRKDSKVLLEQARAVDMQRLGSSSIAYLDEDDMTAVNKALGLSVGLERKGISYEGKTYKRGEIYLADLGFRYGREYWGITPVVVVQNNKGNDYSPTIIVVPISDKKETTKLPTHIMVKNRRGLRSAGIALCEQVRTIDKIMLYGRLCRLSIAEMERLDNALRTSMALTKNDEPLISC